jgi:hypothetical protein
MVVVTADRLMMSALSTEDTLRAEPGLNPYLHATVVVNPAQTMALVYSDGLGVQLPWQALCSTRHTPH